MTPYYQDEACVIYHGECQEVMASFPECFRADHVITDPPYSDHVHAKSMRSSSGWKTWQPEARHLGFGPLTADVALAAGADIASITRRWIAIFSDTESTYLWRLLLEGAGVEYVRTAFWHKVGGAPQFTGDRPAVACEAITLCHQPGRKRWNGGGKQGIYSVPIVLDRGASATEYRCHTTQKPEELMMQLAADFTDPGESILDPFMGSGTTLVAAKRLGRKAIGIELEEKYCEIAAKRLAQGALPLALEAPQGQPRSLWEG